MKGICFKEPLFRKVVDGTKTQTRRIIDLGIWSKDDLTAEFLKMRFKPRYKVGEIIYLKEPYAFDEEPPHKVVYAFDESPLVRSLNLWKNKLFMPEKYARHFIQITDVTAQRLHDITEADAIAEGLTGISQFQSIWISIHGFSSWPDNPWVWKYTFENIYEL